MPTENKHRGWIHRKI